MRKGGGDGERRDGEMERRKDKREGEEGTMPSYFNIPGKEKKWKRMKKAITTTT